jgi:hypothetical protein
VCYPCIHCILTDGMELPPYKGKISVFSSIPFLLNHMKEVHSDSPWLQVDAYGKSADSENFPGQIYMQEVEEIMRLQEEKKEPEKRKEQPVTKGTEALDEDEESDDEESDDEEGDDEEDDDDDVYSNSVEELNNEFPEQEMQDEDSDEDSEEESVEEPEEEEEDEVLASNYEDWHSIQKIPRTSTTQRKRI